MKIKIDSIKYFFLILPFFEPLLFKEQGFEMIDNIYTVLKIISFLIIAMMYIYRKKTNKLFICIVLLETIIFLSTILHNGSISTFVGPCVSVLAMTMLTDYYFTKIGLSFLKINILILYIQMIINIFSFLIFPNGILKTNGGNKVYFLGIANRFVFSLIPLILMTILYSLKKYKKINLFAFSTILLSIFSTLYNWSVGATLGLFLIGFSILFLNKIKFLDKINMKTYIMIIVIFNILIVFLQVQNYFADFIVNVLKKDVTLTGRTLIWTNAMKIVKEYPIIGFGIQPSSYLSTLYYGVAHVHNLILNYMTTSGIVGITIFLVILIIISNKTYKIKDYRVKGLFNFTIFVILFLSIADSLDAGIFFMIYMCMYNYMEVFESEKNRDINI